MGIRRRHQPSPVLLPWIGVTLLAGSAAAQARPQPGTEAGVTSPDSVAAEFHRGFQSMAWAGLVQRIHPDGLRHLRVAVDILVDIDPGAYVLESLLGGITPEDYPTVADDEVVVRILDGVRRESPGLLSSLVSRRTEILGTVPEGLNRHVVYRTRPMVSGAEPRIEVLTLRRYGEAWRVVDAPDLQVLHTAIRGIPLPPVPRPSP